MSQPTADQIAYHRSRARQTSTPEAIESRAWLALHGIPVDPKNNSGGAAEAGGRADAPWAATSVPDALPPKFQKPDWLK